MIAGQTHPEVAKLHGEEYRISLGAPRARPRPGRPRRLRRPLPRHRATCRRMLAATDDLPDAVPLARADRVRRADVRDRRRLPDGVDAVLLRRGPARLRRRRARAVRRPGGARRRRSSACSTTPTGSGAHARRGAARSARELAWPAVGAADAPTCCARRSRSARRRRRAASAAGARCREPAPRPPADAGRRRRHRPARRRQRRRRARRATAWTTSRAWRSSRSGLDRPARRAALPPDARPQPRLPAPRLGAPTPRGMHNFMTYDRRWLDEPHGGDHLGRAAWALGEVVGGRAGPPRCATPACGCCASMLPALAEQRWPAHDGLRRARPRPRRTPDDARRRRRRGPARRSPAGCSTCSAPTPQRRLALVRGRPDLRQRPAAAGADRRRRPAGRRRTWLRAGLRALDWYAGELRHRRPQRCGWSATSGRAAAHPTGHRRRRRAAARRRRAGGGRGRGLRRHRRRAARARDAVRAFEWFLGRNRLGAAGLRLRHRRLPRRARRRRASTTTRAPSRRSPTCRRCSRSTPPACSRRCRRMKLALLGPIAWRTPPRHYGPWEQVTGLLADGLAARGVDVTLFATLDSITLARARRRLRATRTRRTPSSTGGSGRRCTSPTRCAARRSSTWSTTTSTGCRSPSPGTARAPLVTTIHGFSVAAHPAGLPARRAQRVRVDLRRRPRARARLRRHRPPRRRPRQRCRSPPPAGDELVCFGRIHPDKGTARGDRDRRAAPSAPLCSAAPCRTSATSPRRSSRTSTATGSLPRLGRAASSGPRSSGRRLRCCTRSRSPSRSGSRWSSRCCAARRSSRTPAARCPRSSTTASPASSSTDVDAAVAAASTRAAGSTAPRAAASAERRFSADRMVDDYLDVYDRVLGERASATALHPPPRQPAADARSAGRTRSTR